MKKITLNKDKNIGKVLFIVEGLKTEYYLLNKIFTGIFDYQFERYDRMAKYNAKDEITSSVFVINTEESAFKFIDDTNEYLNKVFELLIDTYNFPVDRAAIFYIFDRDAHSNTDSEMIRNAIKSLSSSRDSNGFNRQGLLILSYPCIESFTVSNFISDSYRLDFETGRRLKKFIHAENINQSKISDETILHAVKEMNLALRKIDAAQADYDFNLDEFADLNLKVFNYQEDYFNEQNKNKLLSLLSIVFLDLGLMEVEE
ncbi:hypothetical protein [Bacillus niameyensis]|uniref:hypothetical protein n=1 Tax=Bacillus niameyensis TaxID=1522308 RepID=UPI000780F092|nr:hypothetical protein [Bacillus niameyensis]